VEYYIRRALQISFHKVPIADRQELYDKILLQLSPDNITQINKTDIDNIFSINYTTWLKSQPLDLQNDLQKLPYEILQEVHNEYKCDLNYNIYYPPQNFSLAEQCHLLAIQYDARLRQLKFLTTAMGLTLIAPLPTKHISWTTHQESSDNNIAMVYHKASSRQHIVEVLDKENEKIKTIISLEPWANKNHEQNTLHIIDNGIYQWNNKSQSLNPLQHKELSNTTCRLVKTPDSIFISDEHNGLYRSNVPAPEGVIIKPQYIFIGNNLYFYDGKNDACQKLECKADILAKKFPPDTKLSVLSQENLDIIASNTSFRPHEWHWLKCLKIILGKLVSAILFFPFLVLAWLSQALHNIFIPIDKLLYDVSYTVKFGLYSAVKGCFDIYDHTIAPIID
jgi:hypothetical protein